MIEATHDHYAAREVWEAISSRLIRKARKGREVLISLH
jgi:hypothetical protein